jgi:hypothetical protein
MSYLLLPTPESNKVNNRYLIVVIVKPVYRTSSLLLKIALIALFTTRLSIKTLMTTARGRSWYQQIAWLARIAAVMFSRKTWLKVTQKSFARLEG